MNIKQLTGNAGVFYACYRLSLLGWNALPTVRNAKGPDIIPVNDKKILGIRVSTQSGATDISMDSKNYDDPSIDYWIILLNARKDDQPRSNAYIISKNDIISGMNICKKGENSSENLVYHDTPKEDGTITYWINENFLLKKNHGYSEAWQTLNIESN